MLFTVTQIQNISLKVAHVFAGPENPAYLSLESTMYKILLREQFAICLSWITVKAY